MRRDPTRLAAWVLGAVALDALLLIMLAPTMALTFQPVVLTTALVGGALVAWALQRLPDPAPAPSWPLPLNAVALTGEVHELGVARTMSMLQSAERGSSLSVDDVARVLADVTARQLILTGADPAAPFADASQRLSPGLWAYLARSLDGRPAERISQRRLDAYLTEISSL